MEGLGNDGYHIISQEGAIYILGGDVRGTLYGVYSFFESYAGCRWFTAEVSRIPKRHVFEIPLIDETYVPPLFYRDAYFYTAYDWRFAARNKLNGTDCRLNERHGGKIDIGLGLAHTFQVLVPQEEYFNAHPEYFPLVNGKRRQGDYNQLCLTNPDVLAITIEKVKNLFRENPNALICDVSQMDCYPGHDHHCECEACQAIAREEESEAGPVIRFVNAVADAVADEFPGRFIYTLAYSYTVKPPKHTRPRDNVMICYCIGQHCTSHTIEGCTKKNDDGSGIYDTVKNQLSTWSKISNRLFVWDYIVNFSNYLPPFPNLHTLQDNIRFYMKNHAAGVFSQGSYQGRGCECQELKAYLVAKLLWNPDIDVDITINEFLCGVYGGAAPHLRAYIDALEQQVENLGLHFALREEPSPDFYTPEFVAKLDGFLDQAERAAETDEILHRVKAFRMSLRYAKMVTAPLDKDERMAYFEAFWQDLASHDIGFLWEGGTPGACYPILKKRVEERPRGKNTNRRLWLF